jgi:hypothetical protein
LLENKLHIESLGAYVVSFLHYKSGFNEYNAFHLISRITKERIEDFLTKIFMVPPTEGKVTELVSDDDDRKYLVRHSGHRGAWKSKTMKLWLPNTEKDRWANCHPINEMVYTE